MEITKKKKLEKLKVEGGDKLLGICILKICKNGK